MASKTRVDILEINLREPHLFIHYIGVSMNYVFVQNININICFFYEVKDSQNRLINTTTQSTRSHNHMIDLLAVALQFKL